MELSSKNSRNIDQVYLKIHITIVHTMLSHSAISCKHTPVVQFCILIRAKVKNASVPAKHILLLQPRQHLELCLLHGQISSSQVPSRPGFETTHRLTPLSRYPLSTTLSTSLHVCIDCEKYAY